jgi:hypothetical protein
MPSSRSDLILWLCFGLACLFLYPFNEKVICETRHEGRAIQLMSYTKLQVGVTIPVPWATRHNWLEERLGVRFVDGWQSRWLIEGVHASDAPRLKHTACFSAVVTKDSFIYFPIASDAGKANATFEDAAFAVVPAMPPQFQHRWSEGFISGGFPLFFYSSARPLSQDMRFEPLDPPESENSRLHFVWVTTSFDDVDSKRMLATQYGRVAGEDAYRDFSFEAYQMGGHPVSAPGMRQKESLVSLKRRLRSQDGGRSWELHDWEVLRPELIPSGRRIVPTCPC